MDPNTDAASRKPEFMDRSADWILTLPLPQGARLLDIGCGPGLYAKRFAERGLRVTGMDFSERSIAYAKERDPKSEYLLRDYLTLDFANAFDIVTLIYCDYGALIPEEREALLRRVYRALKPGGLFLFDVFTPEQYAGRGESASWFVCENGGFWSAKPHICLKAEYFYDKTAAASRYVVIEDVSARCYNVWDTCFTRQSLQSEVLPIGFAEEGLYGDVTGKPYTGDSRTMCVIFSKK
ncbi:MAG: class I SAM-dependent methyltransferase [Clostridiales bacterium]|nr:class I SAM-dependent methyltransferase [Clostridiales bacterium]